MDKDQPIGAILTMDEQLSKSLTRRRFSVTLLSAFGVVAVSLAAIGLYGVLAFIVAQRRREIGVRMALGAQPRDVIADVMGQGLRLAGLGVVVGIGLALAGTRLLRSLLFGTSPTDAITFVAVATLLVVDRRGGEPRPRAAREPCRSADRAAGRVTSRTHRPRTCPNETTETQSHGVRTRRTRRLAAARASQERRERKPCHATGLRSSRSRDARVAGTPAACDALGSAACAPISVTLCPCGLNHLCVSVSLWLSFVDVDRSVTRRSHRLRMSAPAVRRLLASAETLCR